MAQGHDDQDCPRRDLPEIRKVLGSVPGGTRNSEGDSKSRVEQTTKSLKRKRELMKEASETCEKLITELLDKIVAGPSIERTAVPLHHLEDIMPRVREYQPDQTWCEIDGINVHATIARMKQLFYSESCRFASIKIEAGFTIHCAVDGCNGRVGIFDHESRNVRKGTHSGFAHDKELHAVFLAWNCHHDDISVEWRRVEEKPKDMTSLRLLQAAKDDPVFVQYSKLKFGLFEADLDEDDEADESDDRKVKRSCATATTEDLVGYKDQLLQQLLAANQGLRETLATRPSPLHIPQSPPVPAAAPPTQYSPNMSLDSPYNQNGGSSSPGGGSGGGGGGGPPKQIICTYCNKRGHIAPDCRNNPDSNNYQGHNNNNSNNNGYQNTAYAQRDYGNRGGRVDRGGRGGGGRGGIQKRYNTALTGYNQDQHKNIQGGNNNPGGNNRGGKKQKANQRGNNFQGGKKNQEGNNQGTKEDNEIL
ncbi:hypothetical protein E4T47_08226 [Aureobasidium subglaciale]|nr:hypothetical protein E4T47_08226 [Aureobasidium subglaciale]